MPGGSGQSPVFFVPDAMSDASSPASFQSLKTGSAPILWLLALEALFGLFGVLLRA